jgi:ABC-type lipoprotein release transport system permease subunit
MSPLRLALRNVLLGPRPLTAAVLVATGLSALDLFAGHMASERSRLEYQAVFGERLGHLAVLGTPGFDANDTARIKRVLENVAGVALVVPQIHLEGVAAGSHGSSYFSGAGIVQPAATGKSEDVLANQPGRLLADRPSGIAVSSSQAKQLGLRSGSAVTLSAITSDARPAPVNAQVVDIFSTAGFDASARSILMPLEMAKTLLDTDRVERLAVYLSDPRELDEQRGALVRALRLSGSRAQVRSWQELSAGYAKANWAARLKLVCVSTAALAAIWVTVAATMVVSTLERKSQLATLRALGMRPRGLFLMLAAEAGWIAVLGGAFSVTASGLIAWVTNRAALSFSSVVPGLGRPQMLVELDAGRMLVTIAAVLIVAMLAALLPALKAARADIARSLYGDAGW